MEASSLPERHVSDNYSCSPSCVIDKRRIGCQQYEIKYYNMMTWRRVNLE